MIIVDATDDYTAKSTDAQIDSYLPSLSFTSQFVKFIVSQIEIER